MEKITDWPREAAANLSGGFKRSESIKMLTDKGLDEDTAIEIIDELLLDSRNKGFKRLGFGLLCLIGLLILANFLNFFPFDYAVKPLGVLAILALGDGIRRLGSLWMVSKG